MSQEERKQKIIALIGERKFMSIKDIADNLRISGMTVRRYLSQLEKENKLVRTYGGVMKAELYHEHSYFLRQSEAIGVKEALATAAAAGVQDGQTILLDAGSTCFELAKLLLNKKNLTIVTHDISSAALLFPYHQVYILGGAISKIYGSVEFTSSNQFLNSLRADLLFLGVSSISNGGMLSSPLPERAALKQLYLSRVFQKVLLADSSKFGRSSFIEICSLSAFDKVYTDCGIDPDLLMNLSKINQNITCVELPNER